MDPTILTKILAAGAMGVSIFCIWKVYDLLHKEQEKPEPHPLIIRTIYVAMAFAVVMTLLSLGIEYARHNMSLREVEQPRLSKTIERIAQSNFYSLDQSGAPKPITIDIGDSYLTISKALPNNFFANTKLSIRLLEEKYLVQREKNGQVVTAGYLLPAQLGELGGTTTTSAVEAGHTLNGEDIFNLGLSYSAPDIIYNLNISPARDEALAVSYLIQLLADKFQNQPNLQKKAVRILTQPRLMQQLQEQQYEALIAALESDRIRRAPYNSYELAQVYHSRAYQTWNRDNRQQDITRYTNHLLDYVGYYEANTWIQDRLQHPTEAIWYEAAKRQLQ